MNRRTYILGNLGLSIDKQVSSDMHEFDESAEILLDGSVVHDDQRRALLGADTFLGIIETRQRPHGPCRQARDGSSKDAREPYPDGDIS